LYNRWRFSHFKRFADVLSNVDSQTEYLGVTTHSGFFKEKALEEQGTLFLYFGHPGQTPFGFFILRMLTW